MKEYQLIVIGAGPGGYVAALRAAGRCVGMVGSALVFEQGGLFFVASIREWESHEVDVLEDEVLCAYEAAPQQFSLF